MKGSRCEKREQHKERAEHNRLFMEKAERSLLFLTAAGTVCSIGDCELYGPCVLILAMIVSGDLWVHAEEEERLPCLREKRAVSQEKYHLEAYDCSKPDEIKVYPTLLQCPETKGLTSPSTLVTTNVEECAFMESTGFFRDPAAEKSHKLNKSSETNYFYSTVVGSCIMATATPRVKEPSEI